MNIVDPPGALAFLADRLRAAGYLVRRQEDRQKPMFSGWLVTGHRDGRPLNEAEIMSYLQR